MSEASESPNQRIERLERELRLARAELDDFTRAVSHDLRAPLRHLGAYTQILREDLPEPQLALALPHLERISEAARLMGLPDSYRLPDSYSAACHLTGDGVAVPVVRHLAQWLIEPLLAAQAGLRRAA